MNDMELSELRRRLKRDHNNMTHIYGCYVSETKDIISNFDEPVGLLSEEDADKYFGLLKKVLSGTVGRNVLELDFSVEEEMNGEAYKLLSELRSTEMKDNDLVNALFGKVIDSVEIDGRFLILLAYDAYDIPFKGLDGFEVEDASEEVYNYIICAVCPVKERKPALKFNNQENRFHITNGGYEAVSPELGFVFPTFRDRSADVHAVSYYTKDIKSSQTEFIDQIFHTEIPIPAQSQVDLFKDVIEESLGDEVSCEIVRAVQDKLIDKIDEHDEIGKIDTLTVKQSDVKEILEDCGVSNDSLELFDKTFEAVYGKDAEIIPQNIMSTKKFEVKLPDITISVNPSRSDLVETCIIDGERFIVIKADEGVEVNGINVNFKE